MDQNSQDRLWDHFQNKNPSSFNQGAPRFEFLVARLKKTDRVLNIGAGNFQLERLCLENDIDIYTLDPSEETVGLMEATTGLADKFKVGYSSDIPFGESYFDVVIMSEVLEHLNRDDYFSTLKGVLRVLKSGGRFIGTVPNQENLELSKFFCPSCGTHSHKWGHLQSFTVASISDDFSSLDYQQSSLTIKQFIDFKSLNWKGRLGMFFFRIMFLFNIYKKDTNIYFNYIKK